MSLSRKTAILGAVAASFLITGFIGQAIAQQKPAVINTASPVEVAFRNWLSVVEKSGGKASQTAARYDAGNGILSIQGLSVVWPQSRGAEAATGTLEIQIGDLAIKGFQSSGQGGAFQSLRANGITFRNSASTQADLKIGEFTVENGKLPSLSNFVADPAKPFTTQIRLMRLLANATIENASAKAIDIGSTVFVEAAILEGFSSAEARILNLSGVQTKPVSGDVRQEARDFSVASIKVSNINLDTYLRLFEPSAYLDRGSARPWTSMIEALELTGLKVKGGAVAVDVASIQAGPLKVKQFGESLTDIFDRAAAEPGFLAANPESAARLSTSVRDAFALDGALGEGIAFEGQNQSGSIRAVLAKAAIENFTANSISRIKADGLKINDATGEVALSTLDIGGVNLVPVKIDVAKTSRTSPAGLLPEAIVPTVAAVKANGLSVKLQGVSASLDNFDLAMAYFIGATPTNVKAKFEHLKFRASDVAIPQVRQTLIDLGYSDIDLSLNFSGFWDDSSSSVLVEDLSVVGIGMASLTVSGALAGVSRLGLESPTGILPQELSQSGLKNLRVTFQNDSIFDRFIGKVAEVNGKSVEDVKKLLSSNLPNMLSGINPSELRNRFVFAAIAFLNNPQVLTFGATPSSAVPVHEIAAAIREPSSLPSLLNIEVSANSRR